MTQQSLKPPKRCDDDGDGATTSGASSRSSVLLQCLEKQVELQTLKNQSSASLSSPQPPGPTDRTAVTDKLSDTQARKCECEIELLQQQKRNNEFEFQMKRIREIQLTMKSFPPDSENRILLSKKIQKIISDL